MNTLLYRDRGLNGYFIVRINTLTFLYSLIIVHLSLKKNEVLIFLPSVNLPAIHHVNEKS